MFPTEAMNTADIAAGVLRDLKGGRARELVALALDEALEREGDVEPPAERRGGTDLGLGDRGRRRVAADGGTAAHLH